GIADDVPILAAFGGGFSEGPGVFQTSVCDWRGGIVECVFTNDHGTQLNTTITFENPPGDAFVQTTASATEIASAVCDPIITPNPDNPDVVITMRKGLLLAPEPGPLDGITADQLAARGLDPGPFLRVGLLAPSAPTDTTPPTTVATSSPGPNA